MTKIAVCLLTCGRESYTERTLDSFLAHNLDRSRFVLLHGDDASSAKANYLLAKRAGFQTVIKHRRRQGNLALRRAVIQAAAERAEWTLILENDMESVRPFPWALFDEVRTHKAIYCLRLFGDYKDAAGVERCRTIDKWSGEAVTWEPWLQTPEPTEIGVIHWSAQPSVTKTKSLWALHYQDKRTLGVTARVLQNVMVHIGVERTNADGADKPERIAC